MQKTRVTIYTLKYCPYCKFAKDLLVRRGIVYEEVDFTVDAKLREEIAAKSGMTTAPQIFVGDKSIGGFDELRRLDSTGELGSMVFLREPS